MYMGNIAIAILMHCTTTIVVVSSIIASNFCYIPVVVSLRAIKAVAT